jgi:hypothetical protein
VQTADVRPVHPASDFESELGALEKSENASAIAEYLALLTAGPGRADPARLKAVCAALGLSIAAPDQHRSELAADADDQQTLAAVNAKLPPLFNGITAASNRVAALKKQLEQAESDYKVAYSRHNVEKAKVEKAEQNMRLRRKRFPFLFGVAM